MGKRSKRSNWSPPRRRWRKKGSLTELNRYNKPWEQQLASDVTWQMRGKWKAGCHWESNPARAPGLSCMVGEWSEHWPAQLKQGALGLTVNNCQLSLSSLLPYNTKGVYLQLKHHVLKQLVGRY